MRTRPFDSRRLRPAILKAKPIAERPGLSETEREILAGGPLFERHTDNRIRS